MAPSGLTIPSSRAFGFAAGVMLLGLSHAAGPLRPLGIVWESKFNVSGAEWLFGATRSANGYHLAGVSELPFGGGGVGNLWVAHASDTGQLEWSKPLSGIFDYTGSSITTASDGSILIGTAGLRVIRLTSSGELVWDRYFGGGFQTAMVGDFGGGCFAATVTESRDIRVIALDSAGRLSWNLILGGSGEEYYPRLATTQDGGLFLGITTSSPAGETVPGPGNGGWDGWILRLDRHGQILWQRRSGGSEDDGIYAVESTKDDNCWVGLSSYSSIGGNKQTEHFGHEDWWILRIGPTGERLAEVSLGGTGQDRPLSIASSADGGAVIAGISSSPPSGNKYSRPMGVWVVKVDSTGRCVWQQSHGMGRMDYVNTLLALPDRGHVIAGRSGGHISVFEIGPEDVPALAEGLAVWPLDEYPSGRVLSISAPPSTRYLLEVSADLENWNLVSSGVCGPTDSKVALDSRSGEVEYYRVRTAE